MRTSNRSPRAPPAHSPAAATQHHNPAAAALAPPLADVRHRTPLPLPPVRAVASQFSFLKSSIEEAISHADVGRLLSLAADAQTAEALGENRGDAAEQAASGVEAEGMVDDAGAAEAVRDERGAAAVRPSADGLAEERPPRMSGGEGRGSVAEEGSAAFPSDAPRSSPWAIAADSSSLYDEQAALSHLSGCGSRAAAGGAGNGAAGGSDDSLRPSDGVPAEAHSPLPLGWQSEQNAMRSSFSDVRDALRDHATPPHRDAPPSIEPTARQRYYTAGLRPPARGGFPVKPPPVHVASSKSAARSTGGLRSARRSPQPPPARAIPPRPVVAPPPSMRVGTAATATGRGWNDTAGRHASDRGWNIAVAPAADLLTARHETLARNAALLSTCGFVPTRAAPPTPPLPARASGFGSGAAPASPSCSPAVWSDARPLEGQGARRPWAPPSPPARLVGSYAREENLEPPSPLTPSESRWLDSEMRARCHRDAWQAEAAAAAELPRPLRPASPPAAPISGWAHQGRAVRSASDMREMIAESKQLHAERRAALRGCGC
jgi:hypothetical protein